MRAYELMVILSPEVEDRAVEPSLSKFLEIVTNEGGSVVKSKSVKWPPSSSRLSRTIPPTKYSSKPAARYSSPSSAASGYFDTTSINSDIIL